MDISMTIIWIFAIVVGCAIAAVVVKKSNNDGKAKTKYDERQLRARGDSFKYGFYATLIANAIFMALSSSGLTNILGYTTFFISILIGVIAQFTHAIFHDAYIGLNTNMKKYSLFMAIITIFNLGFGILGIIDGEIIRDGVLGIPFINFLCAGLFFILAAELAIKAHLDKKEK